MVGLIKESVDILGRCGFSPEDAVSALGPLVRGNVQHVLEDGLEASLTGPLERGDIGTIIKHLDSFDAGKDEKVHGADEDEGVFTREEEKQLYKLLSKKILPVAQAKHPDRSYEEIKKLLNE